MLGYTPEEMIGRPPTDFVPEDVVGAVERFLEMNREGRQERFELRLKYKNGSSVYLAFSTQPLYDDQGNYIGGLAMFTDITQRKLVEEELRRSENNLSRAQQIASLGSWEWDISSSRQFWSDETCRIFGLEPGAIAPQFEDFLNFIHPADRERVSEAIRGALDHRTYDIEYRLIRKDGQGEVAFSEDGTPLRMYGTIHDITDHRRMDEALRESEKRYRDLVKYAPTGIYEIDYRSTRFKSVNQAMCDILGYSEEELLSMDPLDLLDEEGKARFRERAERGLSGQPVDDEVEYRVRARDGREIWVTINTSPLFEGNMLTGVMGIAHDITERKQMEERLRESEAKFRGLSTATPAAVIVYSGERTLYANPAAVSFFGYSEEELLAMNFFDIIHPDSRAKVREGMRARKARMSDLVHYEVKVITKSGAEKWLDVSTNMISYEGRQAGIIVCTDITEIRMARKRAEDYSRQLARSNAELQQFAYVASHDLREPLRMVSSFLSLLTKKHGDQLDAQAKQYVSYAIDGAERMRQLIDDLLTYSRVETRGKDFSPVDMNEIAKMSLGELRLMMIEENAEVRIDPLPTVMADKMQMKQLLTNMISNAIKFRGSEPPRIEVAARPEGEHWLFSIKDNGIGIEPKFHESVFNMFQRLHTHDEYPGTGIGLAIARKIVERHGGRIWLESEAGKGSTFFFTLPRE